MIEAIHEVNGMPAPDDLRWRVEHGMDEHPAVIRETTDRVLAELRGEEWVKAWDRRIMEKA